MHVGSGAGDPIPIDTTLRVSLDRIRDIHYRSANNIEDRNAINRDRRKMRNGSALFQCKYGRTIAALNSKAKRECEHVRGSRTTEYPIFYSYDKSPIRTGSMVSVTARRRLLSGNLTYKPPRQGTNHMYTKGQKTAITILMYIRDRRQHGPWNNNYTTTMADQKVN